MRELHFFEIGQRAEMFSNMSKYYDVSDSDIKSTQKHA
jgi:hypothetical protein